MAAVDQVSSAPSWRRVEIALIHTARRLRSAFDHRLTELDLNLNQASLLAFVNDFGGTNQTALAEMVGVGRASCGAMIDQLEARGLVERQPDPEDRRVWLVAITAEGTALVEQFYAVDEEFRKDIRRDISRAERQQLASLLERLGANVDTILATPATVDPQQSPAVSRNEISGNA
ncbi:MAG: MarR family winged helix-turn-helix transcriptional regulator [Acidimicrobiales bacterium]